MRCAIGLCMAVVFILAASSALHAAGRVAVATPARQAPTIDGKLDEACWKRAAPLGDFLLDSGRGIAPDETTVRLCFDKDNLYLGVTCPESNWNTVKAAVRDRDGALDRDDDLEIFFDTNRDRKTYMQFMVNTLGTQADILNGSAAWDVAWTVKVAKGAYRWVAEIAIPLKVLGEAKVGGEWGFNIGRGQPGKRVFSSFAGIRGKWAAPSQFATLKFVDKADGVGKLFAERKGVKVWALRPQHALDLTNLPTADDEYVNAFGTPGEVVPYTFHVLNLETKKTVTVKIAAGTFKGIAGEIKVPEGSLLYLYPKMAGGYAWEFLGKGDTITLGPGERGGFWLDLPVPGDAVPGLYSGKVTLTVDGRDQTRDLKLLALPFELVENPTSCGFHYPKEKDRDVLRESMRLMREHGMTTFAPYGGWGLKGVEDYVKLRKEFGFKGKAIFADVMYINSRLAYAMKLPRKGPSFASDGKKPRAWIINDEYRRRYVARMKEYLNEAKRAGEPKMSFSIGDEFTNDGINAVEFLIASAQALHEGLPDIVLTSDINGYTEAMGASKYLNAVGVNDGWNGPDSHNKGRTIVNPAVIETLKKNGCGVEFINTGTDRFPFGFYLWRMTNYGIESKIEWIWHSSRMQPAWLNVHREGGRTFVTVALKFSRMGTYDTRYAATLEALLKQKPDAKARQLLDDITAHIPVALSAARGAGWDAGRCDTVRWMLAKEIMRVKGKSVGIPAGLRRAVGFSLLPRLTKWSTSKLEKKFVRHTSRTFAAAKAARAPVLDGKLDDAAWKDAEVITGAYRDDDLSLAEGMMTVRVLHTDEGVYLGVTSHEPDPKKIAVSTKGRDDRNLWQVDDIEIFVDPGRDGHYYHLITDSKNTLADYEKQQVSWNGEWQAVNRVDGNTWTCEVFLPFATFGGKEKPWGIMVGRGSPTRGEYYGIMPIKGSWHDTEQFGTLTFASVAPYLTRVDFGRLQAGANKVAFIVVNPTARKLDATIELLLPGGTSRKVTVECAAGDSAKMSIGFDLKRSGEQELTLAMKSGGRAVDTETFLARVDELMTLALDADSVFSTSPVRAATLLFNLEPKQLKNYQLSLAADNARETKMPLEGNRLRIRKSWTRSEGRHTLVAKLLKDGKTVAEKQVVFFMSNPPKFE